MAHPPSIYDLLAHTFAAPQQPVVLIVQSTVAAILVTLLIAWRVGAALGPSALIPDARFSLRNFIEVLFEGVAGLAQDAMGHHWKKFLPLCCTLGLFILVSNLMGLVPGLGGPTSFIETNLSWAIIAVMASEIAAIRHAGFAGWLAHFAPGPVFIKPLTFLIEIISHLIRFGSLTIRLTANMFADHTLLAIFIGFGGVVAALVPWILLGLGVFIAFVQAFIFTFLTMLYIGMGLEDSH